MFRPNLQAALQQATLLPGGFSLDFSSSAASYPGLANTTTGSLYTRVSGVPTLTTGATNPVYEDLGGVEGGGVWVFPSRTNLAPDALLLSVAGGWAETHSLTTSTGVVLGPDGLTYATTLSDQDAGDVSQLEHNLGGSQAMYTSCWVMDDPLDVPTVTSFLLKTDYGGAAIGHFSAWTRVTTYNPVGTPAGYCGIGVAGGTGLTLAGKGKLRAWGFQAVGPAPTNPPLIVSGSATATKELSASLSAQIVDASGNLDFSVRWSAGLEDVSVQNVPNLNLGDIALLPTSYVWSTTSSDGDIGVRFSQNSPGQYVLTVRGVDVLTTTLSNLFGAGQAATVRAWYNLTSALAGLRVSVNGCYVSDATAATTGSALAKPSAVVSLGTLNGSSTAALTGRIHRVQRPASPTQAAQPVEFVLLGDSIVGSNGNTSSAVGSYIYTKAEIDVRRGIGSLAVSGHTIGNQQATWTASPWSTASGISAVLIQVGINDIATGASSATTISRIQSLATRIRADQPATKIALCQLLPCSAYLTGQLGASYQTTWLAVNAAISAWSLSGQTYSADLVLLTGDIGSTLNDGSYNLPAGYRVTAEGAQPLHTNNPGRAANAAIWRAGLVSLGLLP